MYKHILNMCVCVWSVLLLNKRFRIYCQSKAFMISIGVSETEDVFVLAFCRVIYICGHNHSVSDLICGLVLQPPASASV